MRKSSKHNPRDHPGDHADHHKTSEANLINDENVVWPKVASLNNLNYTYEMKYELRGWHRSEVDGSRDVQEVAADEFGWRDCSRRIMARYLI